MFAKERYAKILSLLHTGGAVTTTQLMDSLQVSIETVRRDLLQLERSGQLQRVHGGAIVPEKMNAYAELPQRLEANSAGKAELADTAALLVDDGDIIYIDSGSTAIHFATALLNKLSKLTVVTHSMDVFGLLSQKEGFRLILCGGYYHPTEKAFYGHLTTETLKQLHTQKAFLFPSAISVKSGVWDFDPELAAVQRQIISCSDSVFFLADSDKFERSAMLKLCEISTGHTFVTDSAFAQHYRQLYLEQGIRVITCKEEIERI